MKNSELSRPKYKGALKSISHSVHLLHTESNDPLYKGLITINNCLQQDHIFIWDELQSESLVISTEKEKISLWEIRSKVHCKKSAIGTRMYCLNVDHFSSWAWKTESYLSIFQGVKSEWFCVSFSEMCVMLRFRIFFWSMRNFQKSITRKNNCLILYVILDVFLKLSYSDMLFMLDE